MNPVRNGHRVKCQRASGDEFTVDDPTTWTSPWWTAAFPMTKSQGQIYEYACNEGTYALKGTLAGARAQEKAEGAARKK